MAMMAPSGNGEPTVNRYGLTQVYAPQGGGLVDVVFVHGLNGDPYKTWTSEKYKTFWPLALLPQFIEEQRARILVYGYDADVTSFTDGAAKDKIHNHAESLVASLAANRNMRKAKERPIIFVAHSLGGLVVKRALIYSSEIRGNNIEHLRSIFVSTYGILFLGTPHQGSDVAEWGSRLEWICGAVLPSKVLDSQPQLVDALKRNNETLQNIDRGFIQIMNRFHIFFFHEGKPTKLGLQLRFIVDETSASPTVQDVERAGIPADHSHMCKFENMDAPGFDLVVEAIQRYAGAAPDIIKTRWNQEEAESSARRQAWIQEIIPGSVAGTPHSDSTSATHTPTPDNSGLLPPIEPPRPQMKDGATDTADAPAKPPDPYFIVPPGFRKNKYFVGMEKEYKELDRRLFDKRRKDGTACVLLHGQPGAGKSHLARQYVNNNKTKFSGGIFWISVKSIEESRQAFWNIFQKVIPRDSPSFRDGTNPNDFVHLVKKWFEERHDWLIVFDGVAIDTDHDVTELTQFIPDSKDSSMIYVSRAKNLESKQRLLLPHPIKVGPLKEGEAQKLLFKELHIKKPREDEKKKAVELVKKIGGLPLAIDAISHRLAETHEPLTKYKLSYAKSTLENTYSTILHDLDRLGHIEAWNLINVLCWFAQDLPVEMVQLGLKVLRPNVEVRATEVGGKPDINTTFGILMRYALIERNEPDDRDSTSSSRDSLVEPEPIDMLKIHNVVQSFICDTLNARGLLPQWLEYAVKLFSYSYWQANSKIRQKPEQGRVSDYRYYKVHGQRLWDHTLAYGSRLQPLDDIRAALKPVMDSIDEEIRQRQPNSSQESLKEGVFQISIFDRTSSSSENSIPGPTTPNHRPTPPPLASENEYGFPKAKPPIDSPGSLGTPTPRRQVHIVGSDHDDAGYDGDQEGHPTSHLMEQTLSDITARPPPRSRAQTGESNHEGWEVVSTRKSRKVRRDLGSFRPSPAGTRINKENIPRSDPNRRPHRRESSPALKLLQKVQSQSPPPSRNGAAPPSRPSNGLPTTAVPQPTWAGVAAGMVGRTAQQGSSQQFGPQTGLQTTPKLMDRGRPRDSPKTKQGNAQGSPLASEFLRDQTVPTGNKGLGTNTPPSTYSASPPPTGFRYSTPYPGSSGSLNQIAQARPVDSNIPPYYIQPPVSGPNPAPLPIAEGITITSKRPLPAEFRENSQTAGYHTPASNYTSSQGQISPYQPIYDTPYPPTVMPAGYYSQPVSRNPSHQSYASVAETDPVRYPSAASPLLPPISDSPRDRYPDGQPFRKSPKTSFAIPAYPAPISSRVSPHDLSYTGGWTQQSPPASASYDMTMSRSSSGPGVAVEGTSTGIVPLDNYPGSVQFGEHPPISVEEARLRTRQLHREQQEALRELNEERYRQRIIQDVERAREGGERRESAPYPDINLIPTGSDRMELEGMVRSGSGGRPRGASAPEMEDPVGLGLRMG